jgi:uracil-DNA glycosylase
MNPKIFKQQLLDKLYEPYRNCLQCPLGFLGRKNVVFGEGNPDADLMFVGEAPGKDEDTQGRPFVGRSGQLLTKALNLVGIDRTDVFITNIVKCRPPNNRVPAPIEISTCTKLFLFNQIKIIRPQIICTLGSIALNALVESPLQITKVRGTIIEKDGMTIIPTFHPAYVLRNQSQAQIWLHDFKFIKEHLKKTK